MRITGVTALCLLAAMAALPVRAQPADPIGALFDHRGQEPPDDADEPDAAGQPRAAEPEPAPLPSLPATSGPRSSPPQLGAPVHIDETGRSSGAPPTVRDLAYDSRIRSSFASAEGFQGPLDGRWTLSAVGSGDLYSLQLVDRRDRLEGAWLDLRRKGSMGSSGLVEDIRRAGSELTVRFTPTPGAPTAVATLHGAAGGRWTGDLIEGGQSRAVVLQRTAP